MTTAPAAAKKDMALVGLRTALNILTKWKTSTEQAGNILRVSRSTISRALETLLPAGADKARAALAAVAEEGAGIGRHQITLQYARRTPRGPRKRETRRMS